MRVWLMDKMPGEPAESWVGGSEAGSVVRMYCGRGEPGGRAKAVGSRRWGEAKRVVWRFA